MGTFSKNARQMSVTKNKGKECIDLAENKNICEEVEIAIYSDAELTQEQKNHIENCEECRALLSQVSALKNDLGQLSVPGIREGEIADKVMDSIRQQKLSKPFPKFKVTHHLGSAAAVAVILVAALIIKNPSTDTNELVTKNAAGTQITQETAQNTDLPVQFIYGVDDNETEEALPEQSLSKEADMMQDNGEKTMMFKAAPKNTAIELQDVVEEESVSYSDSAPTENSESSNEATLYMRSDFEPQEEAAPVYDGYVSNTTGVTVHASDLLFDKKIRSQIFLEGEEYFEYNINLANDSLYIVFGIQNYFDKSTLEKEGYNNQRFLEEFENLISPCIQ